MSCLSLCSLCSAWNMHGLGWVGNSLETCCLLAIVTLFKGFSVSLRCVTIMSVVVLWYVLLSSSSVSVCYVIIFVDNSNGTSFVCFLYHNITIGGYVFENCLLISREVRSGIARYARYKIVVVCICTVCKRVNELIYSVRRCPFLRFGILGRRAIVVVLGREIFLYT